MPIEVTLPELGENIAKGDVVRVLVNVGDSSDTTPELQARVGVSASALRLWERQGLVRPRRSNGRYRLYTGPLRSNRVHAGGVVSAELFEVGACLGVAAGGGGLKNGEQIRAIVLL